MRMGGKMTRRGTHKPEPPPSIRRKLAGDGGGGGVGWEEGKAVELESSSGKIPGPLRTAETPGIDFPLLPVVTLCYTLVPTPGRY